MNGSKYSAAANSQTAETAVSRANVNSKNFLFISPNYPPSFYRFCENLKKADFNVFGIGDAPRERIGQELDAVLTEYVYVPNLSNYLDVLNAAKYLTEKYGAIAGIESNNECWLETDAHLRHDLSVPGVKPDFMEIYQHKSKMKERFAAAGVAAVPFVVTRLFNEAADFAARYGYPIFAKPDKGVGARSACKIGDEVELHNLFCAPVLEDYIFEVFIEGNLYSYDGLADNQGNIVFEAAHFFETPIDRLKSTGKECVYYTIDNIPEKLVRAGRAAVSAFELRNRFFHIEFFELTKPINSIGEIGDFVGVEVNMRPAGGFTPEMINAAKGIDVYSLWAQCIASDTVPGCHIQSNFVCVNVGRHSRKQYKYSPEQIRDMFPKAFILSGATVAEENPFGNYEFVGRFATRDECRAFAELLIQEL